MMARPLRIAMVAPVALPVSPAGGSSIEYLVSLLTEELVRRGHDVTLFATGNSRTTATLHATCTHGYDEDSNMWTWEFHETMHAAEAFERAECFDVIHSHNYHYSLPFSRFVRTPVVHTYHTRPEDDIASLYAKYHGIHVVAISHYQRSRFAELLDVPVIHHGIDVDRFPFSPVRGDYLLFLGRMIPPKGPREAIELAKLTDSRLILAGPMEDPDYFASHLAPLVDGEQIEYVGPVGPERRDRLMAGAAALVYPVTVPEPFGLVLVEAMACGTPIAALGCGAVPEIVENGVTGCYREDVPSLSAALPTVLSLDRQRIRREAEERFGFRRMVDEYEALFQELTVGRERRPA